MAADTTKFRAAVVQTLAVLGDLDANIRLLRSHTEEAVRQGAKLVVFPECMNTGYLFDSAEHCAKLAESVTGRYVNAMADLCRQHRIHIASGFTERNEAGRIFNSGLLLDASGNIVLHYHKQFLATHDQNWFEVGERGCPVVDTDLGRIGLLICFDGRIPEIARCLALQGAEVIVDMANFFAMDQADLWVPARAFENGVYFVAATKSGVERSIYYPGGSMIVAPTGDVLTRIPYDRHGVASADIEPALAKRKGWFNGADRFKDRRPDAYSILGKPFAQTPLATLLEQPLVPEKSVAKGAAVQTHVSSKLDSLDEALAMVTHAAKLGVELIVLPQYFGTPTWQPDADEAMQAAALTPKLVQKIGQTAKLYGCCIVFHTIEEATGRLASTSILVGTNGEIIGKYQQVHIHPTAQRWATPGDVFPVFETPFGRVGMMAGYDGLFPESARALILGGADVIAYSCAWTHRYERELLAVPKAEDNRVYVICANRSDSPYPGGSLVIPPNGFPHWDINVSAPPVARHGAVMPCFMHHALAREKMMIPKVDMVRNRLVATYSPILAIAK